MTNKLITPIDCARCRECCRFVDESLWEAPEISDDVMKAAERILGPVRYNESGGARVFSQQVDENGMSVCPALAPNGCRLKNDRPFDCKVWPFRVMRLAGDTLVLTASTKCPEILARQLGELTSFVKADGFAALMFREAAKPGAVVKDYRDGYPILAVKYIVDEGLLHAD